MLKLGDELWMYMPSIEKTQKISGHMLRQGLMGSDMSYEDMMEASKLRENYTAKLVGEESQNGRPCYKLELTAKGPDVAYPKRVSWVDKEWFVPVRQELYALSGALLKVWTMSDIQPFENGRMHPTTMRVEDKLQQGSKTELHFTSMQFSVPMETEVFSERWLER
jgi:outer membrane lipoprotein-sorting protein